MEASASATAADDEGGLTGSVTDESAWQDLGIAIPSFATNANVPTPANTEGTAALGRELARVITADLRNNGLFRPVGPDALPRPEYAEITAPRWSAWQTRGARSPETNNDEASQCDPAAAIPQWLHPRRRHRPGRLLR
ncbi:MAG: hypothetical protein B7Z23_07645 [Pseudomonadales bacterium 32-61-5]|nr:MAG: hypothetical protein B7Z23_07645 [Pseudomonadales bacterium 32-61-5]